MIKLVIISVIAVSGAQFVSENRPNGEYENVRFSSDELRVNPEERSQDNPRLRPRTSEHKIVGGFQNGHFAQNDGRLRTNLDSKPRANENNQPRAESPYVVEEGAAFRRPDKQYDVHGSLGRVVDISFLTEGSSLNEGRQNSEFQRNENREQRPSNVNDQTDSRRADLYNEQGYSDQTRQRDRNINNNAQNTRNKNRFNRQNTQTNQENSKHNEGHTNTRLSDQNDNTQDTIHYQNTQTVDGNQNTVNSAKPVLDVNSSTRDDNQQNYNKEVMDREINNLITKMIYNQSTLEVTTSITKTTKDNELGPSDRGGSRNAPGKEDDKWIWSDGSEKNETTTMVPTVDDRAAFTGNQCPTGQVRFNDKCVETD